MKMRGIGSRHRRDAHLFLVTHTPMTNTISTTPSKVIMSTVALFASAFILFPAFSQAASYAYVNQAGEVNMVEAADANTAIATAPNRAARSGVMLLNSPSDSNLVGDTVSGT